MIEGIGIDIVSNERIRKIYEKFGEKFLRKVFTEKEIEYCFQYKDPIPHLAGRFAVKEAVIKALGKPKGLNPKSVEVIKSSSGMPLTFIRGWEDQKFIISISHEKKYTVALALLIGK